MEDTHNLKSPQTDSSADNWHSLSVTDAFAALDAAAGGLDTSEANARAARFGPNRLPEPHRPGPVRRLLAQFHNLLIYVLIGAAAITAGLGHFIDTSVILLVVLVNAAIGFIQEGRAEAAISALHRMLAPMASVLRDGSRTRIEAEALMPGDVIFLEAGDRVPADARLIEAHHLKVQEAILTGESVAVEKATHPVAADAPLGDRTCMAFSSTLVVAGQGRAIVTGTGARTEIGRISGMLAAVEPLTTPLLRKMASFARWITALILTCAGLLLVYGFFVQHYEFEELFMTVVGLSVAAIPEGLPAVLTITLAIGVRKMADRHAIVRRLPAIETLGALTVICTDKTGTLTRNEMMVASLVAAGLRYGVTGDGYLPEGEIRPSETGPESKENPALREMLIAGALCNDSAIAGQGDERVVSGDPMEGALLVLSEKAGERPAELQGNWTRLATIPFDAAHRFMATLDQNAVGEARINVKGAPEALLELCTQQASTTGGHEPLDRDFWHGEVDRIAVDGQRVIALAGKRAADGARALEKGDLENGLVFLGLVGLIDPPRSEAIESVAECRRAGIQVKMITGDHAATASAIAAKIGLEAPERVLTGRDIDRLDDPMLMLEARMTNVFARTTPGHKLRLVKALQAANQIVAMTGDGVNDAPALKRADAGVAMGITGSDAAKEVADLVLTDDNFASIAAAVREGRTVYDNIRKVISWTLPTNAGEASVVILALIMGLALPFSPLQILWINLVSAGTLGVALAFERSEIDSMRRPPHPVNAAVLDRDLVWHVVLVSGLFFAAIYGVFNYAIDRGDSLEEARTLAVNTLIILKIFHLFYIRNIYTTSLTWEAARGTRAVWISVTVVAAAQLLLTYAPPMQAVFDTRPASLLDGAIMIAIGVAFFAIVEMEKQIRLRLTDYADGLKGRQL